MKRLARVLLLLLLPGAGIPLPPRLAIHVGAWPGRQVHENGAFPARLRSERDRWMLLALIRLMPTAVATAAREVVSDPQEYNYWVDLAKRVVAALPHDTA